MTDVDERVRPSISPLHAVADGVATAHGPPGRMPHFPALDGLRGLAVVSVLLFHAHFEWAQGGFLGVSTFFTLSGFLITSLLLSERSVSGTVDLRRFWGRRLRRLMPASLAALVLVAVFAALGADAVQQRNIAGDVLGALAYSANWRFLFSGQSYADVLGQASPVLHFWSLAIEEQFYLLFPLVAWLLLARFRIRRVGFALVLAGFAAASLALTFAGGLSNDAIYYNTGTRAVELLAGALLATFVYSRAVTHRLATDRVVQAGVGVAGLAALAACGVFWVTVPQATDGLYRGGFAGYSLLTCTVILAAVMPVGPLRAVLAVRPLREIGKISYGVYLYHWPVFLWLSADRTGLGQPGLIGLQLSVTVALALVSFHLLETPFRTQRGFSRRVSPSRLAPLVMVGVAAAVIAVSVRAPGAAIDFAGAETAQREMEAAAAHSGPPPTINVKDPEPPRPRAAFFGDSTGFVTGFNFGTWAQSTDKMDIGPGNAVLGCGIGRGGERRDKEGIRPLSDVCNHWANNYERAIARYNPNMAIVQIGPWEVADRRLEGDTEWRYPGDPVYDKFLLDEMVRAVDVLSAKGAVVLWLTSPKIGIGEKGEDPITLRGNGGKPERMVRLNELIGQLPVLRPGKVRVVDLAGWLVSTGDDHRLRPDGVHFGKDPGVIDEVNAWLGPNLISNFNEAWKDRLADEKRATGTTTGTVPPGTALPAAGSTETYGETRKVLVIGDAGAKPVVDALTSLAAEGGGIEVTAALTPSCGNLPSASRRATKSATTDRKACTGDVLSALEAATKAQVDYVLVVPSALDIVDMNFAATGPLTSWGDPDFDAAATAKMRDVVAAFNKAKILVAWLSPTAVLPAETAGPATTTTTVPSKTAFTSPAARRQRYDVALKVLGTADAGKVFFRRLDLGDFAREHKVPEQSVVDANGVVAASAAGDLAPWLRRELIALHDDYVLAGSLLHVPPK